MPAANEVIGSQGQLRTLIYGPAKSKKTWWALRAAEFGYRVLLIDMEHGSAIAKQLPKEALKNVYIIDAADGPRDAFAAVSTTMLLRGGLVYFDEASRKIGTRPAPGLRQYNLFDFGRDTVIVFDSYTALVNSVTRKFAIENNIDLADAAKPEWEGYRWCGAALTWLLEQMCTLSAHVVLIAHETRYEKRKPAQGKQQGEVEFTRRQPLSSSNPHGMSIAAKFEDVLYFYAQGRSNFIEATGNKLEDGGSRNIEPKRYDWNEMSIGALMQAAGCERPRSPVEPFDFLECVAGPQIGGGPVINTTQGAATQSVSKPAISNNRPSLLIKR